MENRLRNVEQRTDVEEDRRTQAHLAGTAAQWDFQFCTAQIIGPPAKRIVDPPVARERFVDRLEYAGRAVVAIVIQILQTDNTRAYASNVETTHLWLTEEEPVGQAHIVLSGNGIVFEAVDPATFTGHREDEAGAHWPELAALGARAHVFRVTPQTGEFTRDTERFPARWTQPAVERVVIDRQAEDRAGALADRFAQITAGEQRVTARNPITIAIREIQRLVERHVVVIEGVAADRRDIFRQRHTGPQRSTGGGLLESGVALIVTEIEAVDVAAIDIDAGRNIAIEHVRFGKADLRRLREARIIQAQPDGLAAAAEVALADRAGKDEVLDARETSRKL